MISAKSNRGYRSRPPVWSPPHLRCARAVCHLRIGISCCRVVGILATDDLRILVYLVIHDSGGCPLSIFCSRGTPPREVPRANPESVIVNHVTSSPALRQLWFQVSGFWLLASGFWFQGSGFRVQVSGFWFLVSGFLFLVSCLFHVSGFWFLVSGFWFLVSGFRFQVSCFRLVVGRGTQPPPSRRLSR